MYFLPCVGERCDCNSVWAPLFNCSFFFLCFIFHICLLLKPPPCGILSQPYPASTHQWIHHTLASVNTQHTHCPSEQPHNSSHWSTGGASVLISLTISHTAVISYYSSHTVEITRDQVEWSYHNTSVTKHYIQCCSYHMSHTGAYSTKSVANYIKCKE